MSLVSQLICLELIWPCTFVVVDFEFSHRYDVSRKT